MINKFLTPLRRAKRLLRLGYAIARPVVRGPWPVIEDRPTGGLRTRLDRPAPESVAVGNGNILVLTGWCYHPAVRIAKLRLTRDGELSETVVRCHTRPDVYAIRDPADD